MRCARACRPPDSDRACLSITLARPSDIRRRNTFEFYHYSSPTLRISKAILGAPFGGTTRAGEAFLTTQR